MCDKNSKITLSMNPACLSYYETSEIIRELFLIDDIPWITENENFQSTTLSVSSDAPNVAEKDVFRRNSLCPLWRCPKEAQSLFSG